MLTLAIIGRPNVGKSTLFNRLIGKRLAIVDDTPGVTRDWREGEARLGPWRVRVLDTAGMEEAKSGALAGRMTEQTKQACEQADVVLMLVDARAGITPDDELFARWLRKQGRPVILGCNKAEGKLAAQALAEGFRLGLGEPVPLSAEHGDGIGDLIEALRPHLLSREDDEDPEPAHGENRPMQLAIIGRPNVGKSTLLNALIGDARVLTGPEAGITRDAIAVDYDFEGTPIRLIDTAGMRRKARVEAKLEKLAVGDSLRSIRYAEVVVLVMDATIALEKQDLNIAALVAEEGRSCVIAINKWDLVPKAMEKELTKEIDAQLEKMLPQLRGISWVPVSAEKHKGLKAMMRAAIRAHALWNTELGTGELNRWLEEATERHTPPMVNGYRLNPKYMTQTKTRPPTFTLFSNKADEFPEMYKRYLVNSLRERFGLPGVPIRMLLKGSSNPYASKKKKR